VSKVFALGASIGVVVGLVTGYEIGFAGGKVYSRPNDIRQIQQLRRQLAKKEAPGT
jgi:hypothetical protein